MGETTAHYAKTEASNQTYQVFFEDELILESSLVVKLDEHYDGQDFPSVIYFPELAIDSLETSESQLITHCPIKGDASYWNFRNVKNSIWCYREPYPMVSQIKKHIAFDQSKGFRISVVG